MPPRRRLRLRIIRPDVDRGRGPRGVTVVLALLTEVFFDLGEGALARRAGEVAPAQQLRRVAAEGLAQPLAHASLDLAGAGREGLLRLEADEDTRLGLLTLALEDPEIES